MAASETVVRKIVAETQNLNDGNWDQCSIGKKVKAENGCSKSSDFAG